MRSGGPGVVRDDGPAASDHRLPRAEKSVSCRIAQAPAGTLAAAFRGLPNGIAEMRVALSAGYDTTAHTLAWLLGHVARQPEFLAADCRAAVIDEVLRLYPAGWIGSRRCAAETEFDGIRIRRGALVLYSPYLTQRDPRLWTEPLSFRPEASASGRNVSSAPGHPGASFLLPRASGPAWAAPSPAWCSAASWTPWLARPCVSPPGTCAPARASRLPLRAGGAAQVAPNAPPPSRQYQGRRSLEG
jgi:hypothetical protein